MSLANLFTRAGAAATATDEEMRTAATRLAAATGIDAAPEGGCALHVTEALVQLGELDANSEVVVFNTGSGASYRW